MLRYVMPGVITTVVLVLSLFVWRARPYSSINRRFTAYTAAAAAWALTISAAHTGLYSEVMLRLAFASAGLIPPSFLAFVHAFPLQSRWPSRRAIRVAFALGLGLAALSLFTDTIAFAPRTTADGFSRQTGFMYPVFALYTVVTFVAGLGLFVMKWYRSQGLARAQLQYLLVGAGVSIVGGVGTNLLFPLITGRSTYSWAGPYFLLPFAGLVAHAIIRHRLMDLRLVVHRSLTIVAAAVISLVPVALALTVFTPRVAADLRGSDVVVLLGAIVAATLLASPTRDLAGRILDRYVYRTQANFRRIVREASSQLTRLLDLDPLLAFVARTVGTSTEAEGVAIYLQGPGGWALAATQIRHRAAALGSPPHMPAAVIEALLGARDCVVTDEVARQRDTPERQRLQSALENEGWAMVLPVFSENAVIGGIAVGPKLSGDPFYPHDMDLLLTLANQAGIAIKNAQLYTEVVLAREHVQNIVETIESGVVAVDPAGRITLMNRAAEALTGRAAAPVSGASIEALPAALASLVAATVADGQPRTEPEIELPLPGGAACPVMCRTSPLRTPAGAILGAVAVFSDLTPVKALEHERRQAEQLAQAEMVASSIAHEIKNPLVSIKAFAQLIPRRRTDERWVEEFSGVVTRQVGRIERLLERLRRLSRPSEGPRQRLDVRGPVGEAAQVLRPAFDEKGVVLQADLGSEPAEVAGDHGDLQGLVINLLTNAHEATPPGGRVDLAVVASSDGVRLTVTDSGPGIPSDRLTAIFDPFFTTKPRGSGLGLAIAAGIATTHHAKLRAANHPAGGAVFTVEFPAAAVADASDAEVKIPR